MFLDLLLHLLKEEAPRKTKRPAPPVRGRRQPARKRTKVSESEESEESEEEASEEISEEDSDGSPKRKSAKNKSNNKKKPSSASRGALYKSQKILKVYNFFTKFIAIRSTKTFISW